MSIVGIKVCFGVVATSNAVHLDSSQSSFGSPQDTLKSPFALPGDNLDVYPILYGFLPYKCIIWICMPFGVRC